MLFRSKEDTVPSDKHFALFSVVEVVPQGFPRIPHENTLIQLGCELVRLKSLDICFTTDSCGIRHILLGFSHWFSSGLDGFLALSNANTLVAKKTCFSMYVSGSGRQEKAQTAKMVYSSKNKQVSFWKQSQKMAFGCSTGNYTGRTIWSRRIVAPV